MNARTQAMVQRLWAIFGLTLALVISVTMAWADDPKPKEDEKSKDDKPSWSASASASAAPDKPQTASVTDAIPCSACHSTSGWKAREQTTEEEGATKFDHSTTGFPLTGSHIKAPCVSCHDGKRALKRQCVSCHTDAHRGRLGEQCDRCHSPAGWRNTKVLDMHRMTRFPLTGMHVLTDCTECHRRGSEHQWTGAPIECFACHERDYRRPDLRPVHNGSQAGQNAFPRDCSLCHRALAWAPAKFDSTLITGSSKIPLVQQAPPTHDLKFPIRFGSHKMATCDDCHQQMANPRLVRCVGCHAHEPVKLAAQHKTSTSPLASSCLSCHPAGMRR